MRNIYILAISLFIVFSGLACEKMQPNEYDDSQNAEQSENQDTAGDINTSEIPNPENMITVTIAEKPFTAEVATSEAERAKGLMGRENLPDNYGMWFVFPKTGQEQFWMKDTYIPLDLIYVDENMKVVYIIKNAVPESVTLLTSSAPFKYVLEVNAGETDELGIKAGDQVSTSVGPQ